MCNLNLSEWNYWVWPNSWWCIRHILPYHELFYNASVKHDALYCKWGWKYERYKADLVFFEECLKVSNKLLEFIFAIIYYFLIRLFWGKYFSCNS